MLSEWNFDLKWVIDQISVPLVVMITYEHYTIIIYTVSPAAEDTG